MTKSRSTLNSVIVSILEINLCGVRLQVFITTPGDPEKEKQTKISGMSTRPVNHFIEMLRSYTGIHDTIHAGTDLQI